MVREWLAVPSTNFGLLLNSDVTKRADHYRSFASTRHADVTLRPALRVTYLAAAVADTPPPSVAITAPAGGATVAGTVTVSATASATAGMTGVQFQLDGVNVGAEDTVAPYAVAWNTSTAAAGPHTLTAIARDAAGNLTVSAGVSVTVAADTTPPVLSSVTASSITSSGAVIRWTSDEPSDSQVEYGLTTAYASVTTLKASLVASHVVTLSGLVDARLYHFRVRSRDAAGNLAMSADFTFTTLDGTPPSVALTAPAAG